MKFDKDEIKNSLSIDQVEEIVSSLGGEPQQQNGMLICQTICHNHPGEGSRKLYYYDNTKLFRCYTECGDTFDIFELIIKVFKLKEEDWALYNAMGYVANFFSLEFDSPESPQEKENFPDWEILKKWTKIKARKNVQKRIELKVFDGSFLKHLPRPHLLNWEREGITKEICDSRHICYDPSNQGIVIPHYDKNNILIGIRERTLVKDKEKYGKYKPAMFQGMMYNHPLSFNLYNLNFSKNNIQQIRKAVVFESEKSCLKFASIFGADNDISVAICGSNLIKYQVQMLLELGVEEIIVALDRQYQQIGDKEYQGWVKKLKAIGDKYSPYVNVSFMFDVGHLLDYKDSPIDKGKEIFLQLLNNRLDYKGR